MRSDLELQELYIQLLSDPNCKIKPGWFRDAIIHWPQENMVEFLKENPHMREKVVRHQAIQ